MFEHKDLDGQWNRVIPANDAFINNTSVLECRDNVGDDPAANSRRQYGVIGNRLVERCLPPEGVGDRWSHDASDLPWWGSVKNPPHMGIVAEFNTYNGGEHRIPLNVDQHVVAFAAAGEAVTFHHGGYTVTRGKDAKQITAPTLVALREAYCA